MKTMRNTIHVRLTERDLETLLRVLDYEIDVRSAYDLGTDPDVTVLAAVLREHLGLLQAEREAGRDRVPI